MIDSGSLSLSRSSARPPRIRMSFVVATAFESWSHIFLPRVFINSEIKPKFPFFHSFVGRPAGARSSIFFSAYLRVCVQMVAGLLFHWPRTFWMQNATIGVFVCATGPKVKKVKTSPQSARVQINISSKPSAISVHCCRSLFLLRVHFIYWPAAEFTLRSTHFCMCVCAPSCQLRAHSSLSPFRFCVLVVLHFNHTNICLCFCASVWINIF